MGLGEAADSQTCPRGTAPQLLAPQLLLTVIYCSCQLKTHKDSCCSTGLSNALFAGRRFIEEVDAKKKESMWTGLHNTGPLEPEPRVLTPHSEDLSYPSALSPSHIAGPDCLGCPASGWEGTCPQLGSDAVSHW